MRQVIKHRDIRLLNMIRRTDPVIPEFPVEVDADGWRRLYQTAIRQSLVGVCYKGVCLLPEGSEPAISFRVSPPATPFTTRLPPPRQPTAYSLESLTSIET